MPDKKQRIQLLIDKGANLDHVGNSDTAAMIAVGWGGQYDIALMLLDAGADPGVYAKLWNRKLVHSVAQEERRIRGWTPWRKLRW